MNGKDVLMRSLCVCSFGLLALGSSAARPQITGAADYRPLRQIDHIMIRTGDPRDLYAFFTETLELPVAWGMTSPRAGVLTGGVSFGNVNVEAIQFQGQTDNRHRLLGFALEPTALEASVSELVKRGITVGDRRPLIVTGADGSQKTLWTNVSLPQFSDADSPAHANVHVFLSEYSPSYLNVEERRSRLRKELEQKDGGPLGVLAVQEVVIGVTDLQRARQLWQRLLDPEPPTATNTWQIGEGPAVRLVPAAEDRVQAMVIRVASLDRAKEFLRQKHLLGNESDRRVAIDPAKIGGLGFSIVGN
jgi:catechol 2,3-dioxygenase-like lactoylglutathione lyase family enzyme